MVALDLKAYSLQSSPDFFIHERQTWRGYMANNAQNPNILVNQDKPFVMMPVEVYKRTNDGNAIKLLLYLTDRVNREKQTSSWPSYKTISRDLGMGMGTIAGKIKHLLKVGLLEVNSGSRVKSNNYTPLRYFRNEEVLLEQKQGTSISEVGVLLEQKCNKNNINKNNLNNNKLSSGLSPNDSISLPQKEECDPNQIDFTEPQTHTQRLSEVFERNGKRLEDMVINSYAKQISTKHNEDLDLSFEDNFWMLYNPKKRQPRKRCFQLWKMLSKANRLKVKDNIPKFLKFYRDKGTKDQFIPGPRTYLLDELWAEPLESTTITTTILRNGSKIHLSGRNANIERDTWIRRLECSQDVKKAFYQWFQRGNFSGEVDMSDLFKRFREKDS